MKALCVLAFVLVTAAAAHAELPADLTSPYLQVQVALAGDSTDGIAPAAETLAAAARALGDAGMPLAETADALAATTDIEAARDAFGPLSDALIAYAEEQGLGELKMAFCPMVNKSWIQEDGAIANPFYGSFMLTCGEFR